MKAKHWKVEAGNLGGTLGLKGTDRYYDPYCGRQLAERMYPSEGVVPERMVSESCHEYTLVQLCADGGWHQVSENANHDY
jgi:hypothetical protein